MATEITHGNNPFDPALRALTAKVTRAVRADGRAVRAAGLVLVRNMKLTLSKPGHGIVYRRKSHTHQASAPGEPPAADSGALRNSIGMATVDGKLRVGTGLPEGAYLEHGTLSDGGFIAPRPWARPALEISRPEMGEVVVSELRSGVRGGR